MLRIPWRAESTCSEGEDGSAQASQVRGPKLRTGKGSQAGREAGQLLHAGGAYGRARGEVASDGLDR